MPGWRFQEAQNEKYLLLLLRTQHFSQQRHQPSMSYPQETFVNTTLADGTLISGRRAAAFKVTALYQLEVLKETGRYEAFKLKWHPIYDEKPDVWPVPKHLFWDSDVAKWIEGACYLLHTSEQQELRDAIEELVEMIRGAQQPDGYINIHFTVVEPEKRFTNLRDLHELFVGLVNINNHCWRH
jgi:DUF1680 family protein